MTHWGVGPGDALRAGRLRSHGCSIRGPLPLSRAPRSPAIDLRPPLSTAALVVSAPPVINVPPTPTYPIASSGTVLLPRGIPSSFLPSPVTAMARSLACALLTPPPPPLPVRAKATSFPSPASNAALAAARTAQAAHFTRSLSPCGNCGRVVGAQAYSLTSPPGGAPPALPGVAASAGKAPDGGIGGGGARECFCSADCYWSATLDARGALRRRTKTGRRPARVVAGGAAAPAAGAAGMDGDKPGDPAGVHAKAGGGRFGVALNGERHAMYAHHVEVLQASYCGKTKA